jgi:hypothetical protein
LEVLKVPQPETEDEARNRALAELQGKNVQQYAVLLSAWMQTKMEHDKTLVTASLGGIGFLLSVLSFAGISTLWEIIFFAGAFSCFVITVLSALTIYKRNAKHLENEIRGKEKEPLELEQLDRLMEWTFWIALTCAIVIGTNLARSRYMNATKLSPATKEVKSLTGIENLKPQPQKPPPNMDSPKSPPTSPNNQSGPSKAP